MTDKFELSRRKVLGGLGTIGVASVGAGLGTTAFFSDTETFDDNRLKAGSLDMKAAYSAHYSDWSEDEDNKLDGDVQMTDPSGGTAPAGRVGLPSNVASMISVQDADDAKQFLANTQTGAEGNASCTDGTDAENLASPVIKLGDVKPGDFGEVTFSFALCDNPGYVWMNGKLVDASENGVTEPEADDDDEDQNEDGSLKEGYSEKTVELLDEVKAAIWLDDGNNFQNGGEQPLLVDSLRNVLDELETSGSDRGIRIDGQNVAASDIVPTDLTTYGVNRFDLNDDDTYGADIELVDDPVDSGKVAHATSGGSPTPDYVTSSVSLPEGTTIGDVANNGLTYEYYEGQDNENAAPDEAILLIRDDDDAQRVVSRTWNDGDGASSDWATRDVGAETKDNFSPNSGRSWIEVMSSTTSSIGSALTDDKKISDSSEVLAMAVGRGNSDPGVSVTLNVYYRNPTYNGESLGHFPTSCFRGGTRHDAVFAWWLPVDHANEIQTDSVEFDLGFYTEQCRHNDGSGQAPETA